MAVFKQLTWCTCVLRNRCSLGFQGLLSHVPDEISINGGFLRFIRKVMHNNTVQGPFALTVLQNRFSLLQGELVDSFSCLGRCTRLLSISKDKYTAQQYFPDVLIFPSLNLTYFFGPTSGYVLGGKCDESESRDKRPEVRNVTLIPVQ